MNATKVRKPRQRRQHQRSVKILAEPTSVNPAAFIRLTQDGKDFYYWLTRQPSDFGRAFRLEKSPVDGGDVLLDPAGDSCTYSGHTYGGYCKHQHPTKSWRWRRERYWGRLHKEGE
jgi:hypothetical protein